MNNSISPSLIYEFLSSARVFAKAVRDVIEAAVLKEVAGNKLSMPQLKLLFLVARADAVTIGDAAAFLGVSSPAASKLIVDGGKPSFAGSLRDGKKSKSC